MTEPVRCDWALGVSQAYVAYHDHEWGTPTHDDRKLFEFLVLEGAQAGLSWATVLHRREGYGRAFAQFEPAQVARFDAARCEALRQDPGIIRNRLKIASAVTNARAFLQVQEAFGSFDAYLWRFVDGEPIDGRRERMSDVPVSTVEAEALSRDLRKRGFSFVGSTIVYAYMQAMGLVNDHLLGCYRHRECLAAAR
jgi:DNA-3-methyladenine glycosylase I